MRKITHRLIPIALGFLLLIVSLHVNTITTVQAAEPEDIYEENDTFYTAYNISWGQYDLSLYDEDYFRVNATAGFILHIQIQTNATNETINIELYNSSYTFVKGNYDWEPIKDLYFTVPNLDYYVIRLYSNGGLYNSTYSLIVDEFAPGSIDDKFDDFGGNDDFISASIIWPNFYADLFMNDSDYYRIFVMADEDLEVKINFDEAYSWIDFDILNETGSIIASGIHTSFGQVEVYLNATGLDQNLTIYVWEVPYSGYMYDMDIWTYPGMGATDDPYEENDNINESYYIGYGYYTYLSLADEDWFTFDGYNGTLIEIEAFFNHTENDLDFTIYDSYNNSIGGSYGVSNYENFSFYCYGGYQQYKLQIYSASGYMSPIPGFYNLSIKIVEDSWEENDYLGEAPELVPNYYDHLVLNDNADWYAIWLNDYDNISVYLYYDSWVEVNLELYDQYSNLLLNASKMWDGAKWLNFVNGNSSEYYYIKISGDYSVYNLDYIIESYGDDWAEPNDYITNAYPLGWNYYFGLFQWNDDWYQTPGVGTDQRVHVRLNYDRNFTELYLALYNETGYLLTVDYYSDEYSKEIAFTPDQYHSYLYILIYGPNLGDWYDLDIWWENVSVSDDWAEENDYMANAYPLGWSYYSSFLQWDDDWYQTPGVGTDQRLHVRLEYDRNFTELYIALYNETGYLLTVDYYSDEYSKEIAFTPGQYHSYLYILVYGPNLGDWYNLDIWWENVSVSDDWAEENDYMANAYPLGWSYYSSLLQWDDDWYQTPGVGTDQRLHVRLEYDRNFTELYIALYNETGYLLTVDYYSNEYSKEIAFTPDQYHSYLYILVYGPNLGDWYNLDIWWENVSVSDDWAEENDDMWSARWLDINTYYPDFYQWDEDWYNVWLEPDDFFTISMFFDNYSWTPYLSLWDSDGYWLADGIYAGDCVYSEYQNSEIGRYIYIRITGPNLGDWYDLETKINFGGDDWAEPNDFMSSAYELDWGYYSNLYQFDDDWFQIPTVKDGDIIHIYSTFDRDNDSLNMELVDINGNPVGYSVEDRFDGKELIWNVYGDYGDYDSIYLHIWGGNWGNLYNLNLWVERNDDDWAEENDFQSEARWLDWGYYSSFYQFDQDWFQIPGITSGKTVHVYIVFDRYSTDLSIELIDQYGDVHVYAVTDYSDGKELVWTASGDYPTEYIRVSGPDNGDMYDLNIWWQDENPQDDYMEENDEPQNAAWIDAPGQWNDLIQGDQDYYRFHVPVGSISIRIKCDSMGSFFAELMNSDGSSTLVSDYSSSDGELYLWFSNNVEQDLILLVGGDDGFRWYNLEIHIDSQSSSSDDTTTSGDDDTGTSPTGNNTNSFSNLDFSSIPGYTTPLLGGISFVAIVAIVIPVYRKRR
ncbi:MAG: hypothetical protein K9W44_01975 [Candidatus Lokiarchaeota archaeon]|nr:hypothetical protein [Candidatus Harpocratesius repetitus]